MTATKISYATCPLCEATCGLEIETCDREIISIRGDAQDVFSHGYICPKAYSLKELHADPDCIREPMVRRDDTWINVSWDDAFAEVERGLMPILDEYGCDALAVYVGNPNAHNIASLLYLPALLQTAKTHNFFSASTVDQMPKHVAAGLMFGTLFSIPVPDLERTEYLLLLGANPLVSNGSLMTAPDMRGRLRRLRQRGGKIVVIDPYRTRTAQEADEHHFIKPGCDAYFLFALVHTLFAEGLVAPGKLTDYIAGLEQIREMAEPFTPERVATICGIDASTIRSIAIELAAAPQAAVYGRIGTCTQEFGTLNSWLVDVLNVLTGNLDREGGAMFPKAAAGARNTIGTPGHGRGVRFGRWKSRIRGLPEIYGELPAACLSWLCCRACLMAVAAVRRKGLGKKLPLAAGWRFPVVVALLVRELLGGGTGQQFSGGEGVSWNDQKTCVLQDVVGASPGMKSLGRVSPAVGAHDESERAGWISRR